MTETFTITVTANRQPVITAPPTQTYTRGTTIFPISIDVTDPDDAADSNDDTVTVTGLPSDLRWSSGMVSGTVTDARGSYTVTVTADDGVTGAVTATFTITVTTAPITALFDSGGNFAFVRTGASGNVDRIMVPYLMLGAAGCPATGTNMDLRISISTRDGTLIHETLTNVGGRLYSRDNSDAVHRNLTPQRPLSTFGWQGGAAGAVASVFTPGAQYELVGDHNDPSGLVTRPVYQKQSNDNLPPYAVTLAGQAWYVTDTLSISITQTSPSPPATGYCLVQMADCSTSGFTSCG